ncbi:MAG: DUF3598 family protein [Phormidesmis sp.]
MNSQWQCIQQNIGTWHGSFTQFSPEGKQIKDTPSVLTLEETQLDEKMRLILERSPEGSPPNVVTREFSYPGPAPSILFFETGAFSQGSSQWAAFGQFGAEMSIKVGGRRVRFVIMYGGSADGTSELKYVTLIRESRPDGIPFDEPSLQIKQLVACFSGEASILHADMSPMTTGHSQWQARTINGGGVVLDSSEHGDPDSSFIQELSLSNNLLPERELSQAPILLKGDLTYQLMPLPHGAYCLLPQTIEKNIAFQLEVGWLRRDGERSRLIRYYDDRGVWTASTLVEDRLAS